MRTIYFHLLHLMVHIYSPMRVPTQFSCCAHRMCCSVLSYCLRFWHCFVTCLGSAFWRDARQIRRILYTFDLVVSIEFWFFGKPGFGRFRILPTIQTCYLHLNMTNCFLMQENERKQEQNKRNFWFNRDFSNLSLSAPKRTHTRIN